MGNQPEICIYFGDSTLIFRYVQELKIKDLPDLNSVTAELTIGPLSDPDLAKLVTWLEKKTHIINVIVQSTVLEESLERVTKLYTPISAAGGVVNKGDAILMIKRLGVWDLPKGKIEAGESPEEASVREVEEECGVEVELGKYICSTYHTYPREGKSFLKRTYWYSMSCVDDSEFTPQVEEDIEAVEWMTANKVKEALKDSYGSIREVFRRLSNQ